MGVVQITQAFQIALKGLCAQNADLNNGKAAFGKRRSLLQIVSSCTENHSMLFF